MTAELDCFQGRRTGKLTGRGYLDASVNRSESIKLSASAPIHPAAGGDYALFGVLWQHRWGGDL